MMKIGILCAVARELAPFLERLHITHVSEKAMLTFYEGKIAAAAVVLVASGVCKVNAAIAAQVLIDSYGCDTVINAGTAGGMEPSLRILDTVISVETAYHDVEPQVLTECHPQTETAYFRADPVLLAAAECVCGDAAFPYRVYFGRTVTGEAFIADENRDAVNAAFAPLAVDMETAAVAHVCYVNRVPFLAVRTITDTPDHSGQAAFDENCACASERCCRVVCEIINRI